MKRAVATALLVWTAACLGCADKPAPDFSTKPGPGVDRVYTPPNNRHEFDAVNKGPTEPNPRPNQRGK